MAFSRDVISVFIYLDAADNFNQPQRYTRVTYVLQVEHVPKYCWV